MCLETHKNPAKDTYLFAFMHTWQIHLAHPQTNTVLLVAISNHIRASPTFGNSGVLAGYKDTRFGFASGNSKLTSDKCLHLHNEVEIPAGKVL